MYTLINSIPLRQLILEQTPIIIISFIIAELFYKFHSFTLECLAFLVTWYVLDVVLNFLTRSWKKQSGSGNS
jgi:hypothetical protein